MWFRPENIPAYTDDELGEFNDLNGYNGEDQISDPMDDNGHGTHCAGIIGAEALERFMIAAPIRSSRSETFSDSCADSSAPLM